MSRALRDRLEATDLKLRQYEAERETPVDRLPEFAVAMEELKPHLAACEALEAKVTALKDELRALKQSPPPKRDGLGPGWLGLGALLGGALMIQAWLEPAADPTTRLALLSLVGPGALVTWGLTRLRARRKGTSP